MAVDPALARTLRLQANAIAQLQAQRGGGAAAGLSSIERDLSNYPGRRIYFSLTDRVTFTADQDGLRGNPLQFQVSADGPFVQTHYPVIGWLPSAPATATNFGQWSPIASSGLPTQQNTDADRIDLSIEVQDGGSGRNLQNETSIPIYSAPGQRLIDLPEPTLFLPNSQITITPLYENILFDATAAVPTTGGTLVVTLPGFRIITVQGQ